MIALAAVSLVVAIAAQAASAPGQEPGRFERGATMVLRLDGSRGPACELTFLARPPEVRMEPGSLVMICDRLRANRALTETESADFLRLARAANLYATKGIGRDGRAGDLFLTTLTVHDQGAIVILVVSGNPEFDRGPRSEFLAFLQQRYTELRPRVAPVSKAP